MPLAGYGLYSATKHALEGFFESAHMELFRQPNYNYDLSNFNKDKFF